MQPLDATTSMLIDKINGGEFTPNPPIIYSWCSGHLLLVDGHHRLSAIYHSGVTVQIEIRFEDYKTFAASSEVTL